MIAHIFQTNVHLLNHELATNYFPLKSNSFQFKQANNRKYQLYEKEKMPI